MGRKPQPERRAALLNACTDHLVDHGLVGLSLASMALTARTSPRMLVYHFGTKDQLVREMLREARRRQRALVEDVLQPRPGTPYAVVLKDAWPIMISREVLPYFRLFRELHDLPERISPWKEFRTLAIRDWLPVAEAGLRSDGHAQPSAMATVLVAICRGLLLDLNVTGDDQRTTSAFNAFLELLPPARRSTSA